MPELAEEAVAILMPDVKPGPRLGRLPLDRLRWPLGRPARLMRGTVADMARTDHLIGFPQNLFLLRPGIGTRARVSILMAEPAAIHGAYHRKLARIARRFHRVLSYNEALLARLPNGVFFPYGSTWVPEWRALDLNKTAMCSLIASSKRSQEGHALRHATAQWARAQGLDVAVMGQGYRPFGEKAEGLAPFRYSVVIENVRERNCFTEKLIDAVLCRTVPIYWGCPNIGDFIDTSGMILCQGEADIRAALCAMSQEDYAARLPALDAARPQAEAYADILARAARAVLTGEPVPPVRV